MLKYVDTKVTFSEVPDEISLCINISNCPNHCEGCHSPYLANDVGDLLTLEKVLELCKDNKGITCVCLMGGDADILRVAALSNLIKKKTNLRTAWYSGSNKYIDKYYLKCFDYIKVGPYIKELGPLDNPKTNQKMFKIYYNKDGELKLKNITSKFWKL